MASLLLLVSATGLWAQVALDRQLLVNPGAEDGPAATADNLIVAPVGWDTRGTNFTVEADGPNNGIDDLEKARVHGGRAYFSGGPNNALSLAVQDVDVSPVAADVDSGHLLAILGAQMTGYGHQDDSATTTLTFLNVQGQPLGAGVTLGPQSGNGGTWRFLRGVGVVPSGTRILRVTLTARRLEGAYNDANWDNLSLVLTAHLPAAPQPDPAAPSVPTTPATPGGPLSETYGANLLSNPGAEDSAADPSTAYQVVYLPGWTTTGNLTAVDYEVPAFLDPAESDRIGGGRAFFAGGPSTALSTAAQAVDIGSFSGSVDDRRVTAHLEAQMASYLDQADSGTVQATFLDGLLAPLGSLTLGPYHGSDPLYSSFAFQQADGAVPPGTRFIQVMLIARREAGDYNDAYFDNLALVLNRTATGVGDVNGDGSVDVRDVVMALRATVGLLTLTAAQAAQADLNGDGSVSVADVSILLSRILGL
jgi:hypothetical protein